MKMKKEGEWEENIRNNILFQDQEKIILSRVSVSGR